MELAFSSRYGRADRLLHVKLNVASLRLMSMQISADDGDGIRPYVAGGAAERDFMEDVSAMLVKIVSHRLNMSHVCGIDEFGREHVQCMALSV